MFSCLCIQLPCIGLHTCLINEKTKVQNPRRILHILCTMPMRVWGNWARLPRVAPCVAATGGGRLGGSETIRMRISYN